MVAMPWLSTGMGVPNTTIIDSCRCSDTYLFVSPNGSGIFSHSTSVCRVANFTISSGLETSCKKNGNTAPFSFSSIDRVVVTNWLFTKSL